MWIGRCFPFLNKKNHPVVCRVAGEDGGFSGGGIRSLRRHGRGRGGFRSPVLRYGWGGRWCSILRCSFGRNVLLVQAPGQVPGRPVVARELVPGLAVELVRAQGPAVELVPVTVAVQAGWE